MPFGLPMPLIALVALALALAGIFTIDKLARRRAFVLGGLAVAFVGLPAVGFALSYYTGGDGSLSGPRLLLLQIGTLIVITSIGVGFVKGTSLELPRRRPDRWVWAGAMVYGGALLFGEAVAGMPRQPTILFVLALTAIWIVPLGARETASILKAASAIVVIGSLVVAATTPAAWVDYGGSWIGVPIRLKGLTNHPNALAPFPIVLILLELYQPSQRKLRVFFLLASAAVLILAQSKTSWVIVLVLVAVLVLGNATSRRRASILVTGVAIVAAGSLLALAGDGVETVATVSGVPEERLESATTLTGRTELWSDGLEIWQQSPLLGAGPDAFEVRADELDAEWSGQAHNQAVQELGTRGVVGLLSLLVYLTVLVRAMARSASQTRWISVALVTTLLLRAVTETPVDTLDALHLAIFSLALAWERDRQVSPTFEPVYEYLGYGSYGSQPSARA